MKPSPVLRLTQEAYDTLRLKVEQDPEIWLNPEADFHQILLDLGITNYTEETGISTDRPISLVPIESGSLNRADRQALDFYKSFNGLTPNTATDERMWGMDHAFSTTLIWSEALA